MRLARRTFRAILVFAVMGGALQGCGNSTSTVILVPGAMELAPSDTAIAQHATFQLRATVYDTSGDVIPVLPAFESDHPDVVTVTTTGLVRSAGPSGFATITATLGPFVRHSRVTVVDSIVLARVPVNGRPYGSAISSTGLAYVTQLDVARLAQLSVSSRTVTGFVTVGSVPTEVVFNSAGDRAYVTNQFNQNVGVVDVSAGSQIDVIPVSGDPFDLIVSPGDSILFVGTNAGRVYRIRLATKTATDSFVTGGVGNGFVIQDTLLYVSTHSAGTVIEYNLRTRAVSRTFAVGGVPQKLALSPDGSELYIANQAGYVQFWNRITGAQIGTNVPLPESAGYGMARRASNGLLYVTSARFGNGDIHIVDPATRTLVRTAIVGGVPRDIVFDAAGTGVVANEGGWVDIIR